MWDTLWIGGPIATMDPERPDPYGAIENGAIAASDGKIAWVGAAQALHDNPEKLAKSVIELDGRLATPSLIDCHTHLVFGGNRATEFEARLNGVSYEEIARQGGGIVSTVTATRAASLDDLVASALPRLQRLQRDGVSTVEIKSGYGLDTENEIKMLKAAKTLGERSDVRIITTFLGAHALPPEYRNDRAGYVSLVCDEMMPAISAMGLADAVDVFCESIGFSHEETRRILSRAQSLGFPIKLHAEQLSDLKGAKMAAEMGALSVDHLEYLAEDDIDALKKAGTTAVLLPGAYYFLRETKLPPVDALRQRNVPIALATDCNPGSSPILSPLAIMNMACTLFRLTPEEALAGFTRHAAQALNLQGETGMLRPGLSADISLWNVDHPSELSYWLGADNMSARYYRGTQAED